MRIFPQFVWLAVAEKVAIKNVFAVRWCISILDFEGSCR
jgi:hypothetical protein